MSINQRLCVQCNVTTLNDITTKNKPKIKCNDCIDKNKKKAAIDRVRQFTLGKKFSGLRKLNTYKHTKYKGTRINCCKDKCTEYRAKGFGMRAARYLNGYVLCHNCGWLTREGLKPNFHCKCCGLSVRSRPRENNYLRSYQEKKGVVYY